MNKFWMALALTTLAIGCGDKDGDTADTGATEEGDGGSSDGGSSDGGGDDFAVGYAWDASGIAVSITGGDVDGYWFGMAETGAGDAGWYAEDCFTEQAGYAFCHEFGSTGGSLGSVDDPDLVSDSSTTLFNDGIAANITYYLEDVAGNCYTWGQDTSYYSCDVLAR